MLEFANSDLLAPENYLPQNIWEETTALGKNNQSTSMFSRSNGVNNSYTSGSSSSSSPGNFDVISSRPLSISGSQSSLLHGTPGVSPSTVSSGSGIFNYEDSFAPLNTQSGSDLWRQQQTFPSSLFDTTYNNSHSSFSSTSISSTTPPPPQQQFQGFSPQQLPNMGQVHSQPQFHNQTQLTIGYNNTNGFSSQHFMSSNNNYLTQQYQQQHAFLENINQNQQGGALVSHQLKQLQSRLSDQQQQLETQHQQQYPLKTSNTATIIHQPNSSSKPLPCSLTSTSSASSRIMKTELSNKGINSKSTTEDKPPAQQQQQQTVNPELYKTELCSTFIKTNICPYGNKCQFAHGTEELKYINRSSKWRSKMCANWSKEGKCRYGNRCCFKHG